MTLIVVVGIRTFSCLRTKLYVNGPGETFSKWFSFSDKELLSALKSHILLKRGRGPSSRKNAR